MYCLTRDGFFSDQFGMPTGVLVSIIGFVGGYYACARLSGAPPPPKHAINRGIGMEGISCLLTGAFGSGNGTTSYSCVNIGAIGITKVNYWHRSFALFGVAVVFTVDVVVLIVGLTVVIFFHCSSNSDKNVFGYTPSERLHVTRLWAISLDGITCLIL